jgi:hypothetical protein
MFQLRSTRSVVECTPDRYTPWGTREFALYDLDHNSLTFYRHLTRRRRGGSLTSLQRSTLAICRTLALARAAFEAAVAEKPGARIMIRNRTRVVK